MVERRVCLEAPGMTTGGLAFVPHGSTPATSIEFDLKINPWLAIRVKKRHFETIRPLCPVCRAASGADMELEISIVERVQGDSVLEGVLHCSDPACRREYPIVDGIPLIVADLRSYLADNLLYVYGRNDLSAAVESIVGDCCGAGSAFDAMRQHLSSYAWDHYADLDPAEPPGEHPPGSLVRVQNQCLELAGAVQNE